MINRSDWGKFLHWCYQSLDRKLALATAAIALLFAVLVFVNPFCRIIGGSDCKFAWENFLLPYPGKGIALQIAGAGFLYAVAAILWDASGSRAAVCTRVSRGCVQFIEMFTLLGYLLVVVGLCYDLWHENERTSKILLLLIALAFWSTGWFLILRELSRLCRVAAQWLLDRLTNLVSMKSIDFRTLED